MMLINLRTTVFQGKQKTQKNVHEKGVFFSGGLRLSRGAGPGPKWYIWLAWTGLDTAELRQFVKIGTLWV